MPILRHLHLPQLTSYAHASRVQEVLVSRLLRYKAALSKLPAQSPNPSVTATATPPPPPATILTFTPHPIYTTGRRETSPPSPSQLAFLQQPLESGHGRPPQTAEFTQALRGGQITFHGPGQLVIYPILSLAHPYSFSTAAGAPAAATAGASAGATNGEARGGTATSSPRGTQGLSPRCYVHLLEAATIAALARYGIVGVRTENPGVWLDRDTKIAALGVHLRRNVTSHGVGLNVDTDLRWFERIVACGLEGKAVTSMREVLGRTERDHQNGQMGVDLVADVWVRAFARECALGEGDVVKVTEDEVLAEGDGEGI